MSVVETLTRAQDLGIDKNTCGYHVRCNFDYLTYGRTGTLRVAALSMQNLQLINNLLCLSLHMTLWTLLILV